MIFEPTDKHIEQAAMAIREGKLVGLPTETVYGIAANAFDAVAIGRTFELKGRPADNPLIVHLAVAEDWRRVATKFPDIAQKLADAFWPGPLTMVLPKLDVVPQIATGGLETVAVRVPSHPIARRLIDAAGVPVTAPSANVFMSLSPSRAEDIDASIDAGLACVLNGGPCAIGIESTVLDLTDGKVRLLRPGSVSRRQIEMCVGFPILSGAETVRRSPGMYARHYAPNTPIRVVDHLASCESGLTFGDASPDQIKMPTVPEEYAAKLYAALHEMDRRNVGSIAIEALPDGDEWEAVRDRLIRACGCE